MGRERRYGIANVIALMRELPVDTNLDLVMRVVRRTLESSHVPIVDLVDEAAKRAGQLDEAIARERATIAQLEHEIASRNAEVAKLAQERDETREVGSRLAVALSAGTPTKAARNEIGRESQRPTVTVIDDGDVESIPSPEPADPKRMPEIKRPVRR